MVIKHLLIAALLIDVSLASQTLVPGVLRSLHHKTIRRTHSLASDLRVAFRGILFPRAETSDHLVYCKSGNQAPFGGGSGTGAGGGTDGNDQTTAGGSTRNSGSGSSTSRRPSSSISSTRTGTSPSPTVSASSLWKLTNSYVCHSSAEMQTLLINLQQGTNFFDGWDFFIGGDPTNG